MVSVTDIARKNGVKIIHYASWETLKLRPGLEVAYMKNQASKHADTRFTLDIMFLLDVRLC